ncbi:hypothetical protein AB0D10_00800 [Kitasatospora sp. NPDC048545]|uniref:hypothetical protein n=1 Tax=Kitasatospora sp. NPDC048545 TaxID=3157208 RepID=UPI0033E02D22
MTDTENPDDDVDSADKGGRIRSVTAAVKGFVQKHQKAIIGTTTVAAAIAVALVLHQPDGQNDADQEQSEEFGAPLPDAGPGKDPRKSRVEHSVKPTLVKIAGQATDRARAKRAAAFAAGLVDSPEIPEGTTHRDGHNRCTAA